MASRQEAGAEPAARRRAANRQTGIKVTKTIRKPKEPAKVPLSNFSCIACMGDLILQPSYLQACKH